MWVKIDDQFPDHPKIAAVGPLGMALQVAGLCYCARFLTDGFIPAGVAMRLLHFEGLAQPEDVIKRLVEAGVWVEVPGGYQIHDYLLYQPSREQVEAMREQRREAGRRGGLAKSKRDAKQTASDLLSESYSKTEAKVCPVPVPDPDPVPVPDPEPTDRRNPPTPPVADGGPSVGPSVGLSGGEGADASDAMAPVFEHYHQRIGILGPLTVDKLRWWHEEQHMEPAVLIEAIERTAAAREARRINGSIDNYLFGVIRHMYNEGLRTAADLQARARADPHSPDYDPVAVILARADEWERQYKGVAGGDS